MTRGPAVVVDPRTDTLAARREIQRAMQRFSAAVESRNIARVIAAVPSLTPEQQRDWEELFERAPALRFDISVQRVKYQERGSEADLRGFIAYTRSGSTRRIVDPWNMTADLAVGPEGWRIVRLH